MLNINSELFPSTVLIAGGTKGVGKGIALHLAQLGVKSLIICGRDEVAGNLCKDMIRDYGVSAYYFTADLSSTSDCCSLYEFCNNHFLELGGIVYAAGCMGRGTIETTTEDLWNKLFDTNLKGAFFLIQKLLPLVRKAAQKSIVTICSFSSYCGRPELIAYNASKAGLVTLTRSLANTLKDECIRVNGINLGWTHTENEKNIQQSLGNADNFLDEMEKNQPFGRLIHPHDVAALVEYLLSSKSQMMTGSIIDFHQKVRI